MKIEASQRIAASARDDALKQDTDFEVKIINDYHEGNFDDGAFGVIGNNSGYAYGHYGTKDEADSEADKLKKSKATASKLTASEEHQQLLDPVSDSLHHALECANKAKTSVGSTKAMLALVQSIKDAITELTIVQEEVEK